MKNSWGNVNIAEKFQVKKVIPFEGLNPLGKIHKNQRNNHKLDICLSCNMPNRLLPCQILFRK